MSALPKQRLSEAEYLEIERAAKFRSEFINGEMYAMAGGSMQHTFIIDNLAGALNRNFGARACRAATSNIRVRVADSGLYTYPDVLAYCGKPQLLDGHSDTLLNPQLIVEVLSPSTESYDRGAKFAYYRQLDSLTDYVLVSQDKMLVEHWIRQTRDHWNVQYFAEPADCIRFESVNAEIVLSQIYKDVDFAAAEVPAVFR